MHTRVVSANGRTFTFSLRDDRGGSDPIVVREAFDENSYSLHPKDFKFSGVMIDIGANIGAVSLLAYALGAKKVVAYEPEPENLVRLKEHIESNRAGHVIEVRAQAVWSSRTMIPLLPSQGASTSSPAALEKHRDKVIHVPAVTLADALVPFDEVDLLKVDCEGGEYEIFRHPDVHKKVRKIVVEYHTAPLDEIGRLLAILTMTHNVHAWGRDGGQICAIRY